MSEKKPRNVVPLDVTPELAAKIDEAAELLDMPKAQVMRLAMKLGLCDLERVDFKVERLISHAAHPHLEAPQKMVKYPTMRESSRVAEDPAEYKANKIPKK